MNRNRSDFRRRLRLGALDWLACAGTLVLATCAVSCPFPFRFWESDLGYTAHQSGIACGVLCLGITADTVNKESRFYHHMVDWRPFAGVEWFHNCILRVYVTDNPQPHKDGWLAGLNLWPFGAIPPALWSVVRGRSWLIRRRRRATGCCIACGYNLTGNTSSRCPECGGTVTRG